MPEVVPPLEATIVKDIPASLARAIGFLIAAHARLEHRLTQLSAWALQLNRNEARIALREPRAVDRLDMALDIFAIKEIDVTKVDTAALRNLLQKCTSERDRVAHGLWLRHPESNALYLRITRGDWPKDLTLGDKVKRSIQPQSIPYGAKDCLATLADVKKADELVTELGRCIDRARQAFPERFPKPSQTPNPTGRRSRKGTPPRA